MNLPHSYEELFLDHSNLLELYETCFTHKQAYTDSRPPLEEPFTVAARFSRVRLTIHCSQVGYNNVARDDILIVCRSLRHLLLKKHVTVATLQGDRPGVPLANVRGFLPARKLLSGCESLCCQSITFEGFATEDTSELAQLITDDEHVNDVYGVQRALPYSDDEISDQEYLTTLEAACDVDYNCSQPCGDS